MGFRRFTSVCLVLLLSGCSSKLAYNNLDWLAYWYVSDYIELTDAQSRSVKDKLQSILDWHRVDQLPKYNSELMALKQGISANSVNMERVSEVIEFIRSSWLVLRQRVVQESVPLIPSLSPQQVEHLFEKLSEQNSASVAELATDSEKRFEARYEKVLELANDYLGSVSEQQKLVLELYVGSTVDTRSLFLAGNRALQLDAKENLLEFLGAPSADRLAKMSEILNHPENYRSEYFKRSTLENRQLTTLMLFDLLKSLSDEQKRHLIERLEEWLALIDALMLKAKEPT